jgi:hypothetical protein
MKILLVVILAGIFLTLGCTTTTPQQPVVLINTSVQTSDKWYYPLVKGFTYEVKLDADKPVDIGTCRSQGDTCLEYQNLINSTISYQGDVSLQYDFNIVVTPQNPNTEMQIEILTLS